MSQFVVYLTLVSVVLCLSSESGSVNMISGQGQTTDVKVLEESGDCQCASVEDRQRAKMKFI